MGTPIKGKTYSMAPTPEGEEHPNIMVADLRKAAQMALEALDGDHPDIQLRAAITLRAALAQPEPMLNGLTEAETNASASVMGLTRPKPEQEPVAWWDGKESVVFTHDEIYTPNWTDYWTQPLYTAPPQRNTLPLSDDEIKCIKPICADFVSFRAGVRHAEREHGIGGEE